MIATLEAPIPGAAAPVAPASFGYVRLVRRRAAILATLVVALALSCAVDSGVKPSGLDRGDVVRTLLSTAGGDPVARVIVLDIRLPVALTAVVVGASLAVAGAQMQTVLDNPLASPFTLGISAAASFGAALAIVLGVGLLPVAGPWLVTANAFVMAMLASLLVHALSRLRGVTVETVVLLGIALVFTFNALLALLQFVASEQALQEVVFWTLGSLGKASWPKLAVAAAVLAASVPLLARQAWAMTALRLGEAKARSLGIDVDRLRLRTLLLAALLAAVAVAFVGTVGFVGLDGPHIARTLLGEDQRLFLLGSAVAGTLLLSLTSIVSKVLLPGMVFPIGIITALVGVPFFLVLVLGQRRVGVRARRVVRAAARAPGSPARPGAPGRAGGRGGPERSGQVDPAQGAGRDRPGAGGPDGPGRDRPRPPAGPGTGVAGLATGRPWPAWWRPRS